VPEISKSTFVLDNVSTLNAAAMLYKQCTRGSFFPWLVADDQLIRIVGDAKACENGRIRLAGTIDRENEIAMCRFK